MTLRNFSVRRVVLWLSKYILWKSSEFKVVGYLDLRNIIGSFIKAYSLGKLVLSLRENKFVKIQIAHKVVVVVFTCCDRVLHKSRWYSIWKYSIVRDKIYMCAYMFIYIYIWEKMHDDSLQEYKCHMSIYFNLY